LDARAASGLIARWLRIRWLRIFIPHR